MEPQQITSLLGILTTTSKADKEYFKGIIQTLQRDLEIQKQEAAHQIEASRLEHSDKSSGKRANLTEQVDSLQSLLKKMESVKI